MARSWADYQLLPQNLLSESNCASFQAQNFCGTSYGINPIYECAHNTGPIVQPACSEVEFYLISSMVLNDLGNPNNESAYVNCNNGTADFTNCTTGGTSYFSVTSDYGSATPNISKQAIPSSGGNFSGGPYYCPLTRCDVTTHDVWFSINDTNTGAVVNLRLENGQSTSFPISDIYPQFSFDSSANYNFMVNQVGNNLCVFVTTDIGQMIAGCKPYSPAQPPSPTPSPSSSCFSNTACALKVSANSKAFWSVSGKIVECVQDVLSIVFMGNNPSCTSFSFLSGLQQGLRQAVVIALVLYIVLAGLRIVTSGKEESFSKGEFFMLILKFALVLYFSVGTIGSDGQLHNGLTDYIYPGGIGAMSSFAEFVITASNGNGLCAYDPSSYNPGYSYLSIWDGLDCRVAYYLGLYLVDTSGSTQSDIFGVLGVIIPALFSLEVIFCILLIVYGIFILSFVVYFVHFYIIAMIMFAITVYLGVIIVPLALFSYTKGFFDSWVKVLLSYVLQPLVVLAFMTFIMTIFDTVVFKDCQFTLNSGAYPSWSFTGSCSTGTADASCCSSLGAILFGILTSGPISSFSAIFIDYATINGDILTNLPTITTALLEVILFIYLLSLFGEDLNNFAAKLTSGPNIGQFAVNPDKLFKSMISALVKSSTGDVPPPKPNNDDTSVSGKSRDGVNVMK